MPGPVKTEAIVLRSLRYGEADRILRLYTLDRGHVGAIAKGVRRTRSRFGGRLEPFFRLRIELHEGRGELATVTGAQTLAGHPHLRGDVRALDAAARACDAVGRLFDTSEAHPGVYHLLSRALALLDEHASAKGPAANGADTSGGDGDGPGTGAAGRAGEGEAVRSRGSGERARALAFRLKLLLAAGLAPELSACASCGEREHLVAFSGAAGGVVCEACEAASLPLGAEAHRFMVGALAAPLHEAPLATESALGQVDGAISATLEHHAHVRLMPAVGRL
jgi:DNA repair protein RecO (recombination protein O)